MTNRLPVVVILGLTLGCASTYVPREPGRISITEATGRAVLVKDGRRYSMSSEVVEAVSGNPLAENEARTYVRRSRTGIGLLTLGFASFVGGGLMFKDGDGHQIRNGVAIGLEVGYLVSLIASIAVLSTASGHLYDAINIYNDGVPRCLSK